SLCVSLDCRVSLPVFFFQAEDGIRDRNVTEVQTCALPILSLEVPSPSEDFSSAEDFFSSLLDESPSLWLDWAEDSAVGSGFGVLTSRVVFDDLFLYYGAALTFASYCSPACLRWASISSWLTADGLVDSSVVVVAASVVTLPDSGGPMTTVEPTTAAVAAAGTAIAATTGRCLTVASTEVAVDGT